MKSAWVCLVALGVAAGAGATGVGCSSSSTPSTFFSREDMLQPLKCAPCHQSHFEDWSASMHAQAADDPVFIAMNKRGQRETGGKLGTFCVKCHAPMAVRDGLTTNGLNLDSLPEYYKGVTCFFCHSIDSVGDSHNNASVNLSSDLVMRGELQAPPPVANPAHASTYSTFHDDQTKDSATMCGSCHDIESPAGGHIERTFMEWSHSAFPTPIKGRTCSSAGCHMTGAPVAVPIATGGPKRVFHAHDFPAVDISLQTSTVTTSSGPGVLAEGGDPGDGTSSADATLATDAGTSSADGATAADGASSTDTMTVDAGAASESGSSGGGSAEGGLPGAVAVQRALNSNALAAALCVNVESQIFVILDTFNVGHQWPSGAAQDRRAWAEVIAFNADGGVIYSSGVVPDGTPVTSIKDPDLWLLRDCMFDAQSKPVVNFWEAANTTGYELPVLATFDPTQMSYYANHVVQTFPRNGAAQLKSRPARVTLRMRIQPVGLDVLSDLVATNDLDPSVIAKMPTFDVSLTGPGGPGLPSPGGLVWTPDSQDSMWGSIPTKCATTIGFNPVTAVPAGSAAVCSAPSK